MKKILLAIITLAILSVIVGCSPLTQYTLSEQEVNNYLQKHNNYQKQISLPGLIDATIVLTQLQSQIGRSEPGKMTLSGKANVNIRSILGQQNAELQLTLQAQPVYDREKGAIYLKQMTLTDYKVQPENMSMAIKAVMPYLNQSFAAYFEQNPVYILNAENSKIEAMTRKLAQGLEVKPGQLVIPFTQ